MIESGQIHYTRTDHIERPVFATDATGTKTWETTYRPFGEVHTSTGTSDIRFPGQWFQSESGLHQNWMRDYDPTTGRYAQGDPLGLVDGASVYGYVRQNPGRYVDPTGTLGQACLVPGVGQAACAKFVEVCVTAGAAALRYAFRKAVALGGSVILNNDCSGDGCENADEEEVEEEEECRSGRHSPDQQALGSLIKECTRGGRRLSDEEADTVLEWGEELFPIPGPRDDRGTDHYVDGDHIHVPGAGGSSHIPTGTPPGK